jgi:hypothetical protein
MNANVKNRYISKTKDACMVQIIKKLFKDKLVMIKLEKTNNINAPEKYKKKPALK